MILMQELNLAARYPTIYWKTACLTVNSGLIGEIEGNTNYGAVAKAIGDMSGTVLNPDINRSGKGFTPLEEEGKILFGLKPIVGLGKDALNVVLEKRPFTSLEDFVKRAVIGEPDIVDPETKKVLYRDNTMSDKKGAILIKAGCFDNLHIGKSRRDLMIDYVDLITPKKDKLTMVNLPHIINFVPKKFIIELRVYTLREQLFGRKKVPMTKELEKDFYDFTKAFPLGKIEYEFKNGSLVVDKKSFDKVYQKAIDPLKEWLKTKEAADIFNKVKMREFWQDNCMGTVEKWEMESVSFYSQRHELDYIPLHKYFDIVNFDDIIPNNIVEWKHWGKRRFPRYELNIIAGTVVDKDKNKHIVYLLTQYGVVTVKYHKGAFLHYDKKIVDVSSGKKTVLDQSWFTRGEKLVIIGYRRGEEFVPKVYKETAYKHTTMRIESYDRENVVLQMERRLQ